MSINKKITITIILLIIEIIIIFFVGVFVQSHSISIKYNDNKILGKHIQEIVDTYGLFDMVENFYLGNTAPDPEETLPRVAGYYMRDEIDGCKRYYVIIFDKNGIAEDISIYATFSLPDAEHLSRWTKKDNTGDGSAC